MDRPRGQLWLALPLLLLAGCGSQPLVGEMDSSGRQVVLLLDNSTSMRETDPDRAADTGVSLALALLGRRDDVAVITYNRDAEVVVPLQIAGDAGRRDGMRAALADVERNGTTNFPAALARAREVLEAGNAPPGSVLVLLTDGIPYEERGRGRRFRGSVEEELEVIAARGWRIFAIALGQDAATPLLSELVGKTDGAVFPARGPDELIEAFQEVALEALGYLESERGARAVQVPPRTKRLAVLARYPQPGGRPGALAWQGKEVFESRVVRSPGQGTAPLAVALVEDPEQGLWSCDLPGATDALLFLEPPFGFQLLPGSPPARVASGKPFPVAIRLAGSELTNLDVFRRAKMRARLQRDAATGSSWVRLVQDPRDPTRWSCRLVAPRVGKDATHKVVVELELTGEVPFTLRRSRTLVVTGPGGAGEPELPPLELAVETPRIERSAWAGATELDEAVVIVRGDPTRAANLTAPGLDKLVVLAPGARATLELPCPLRGGRIDLAADAEGAAPWRGSVPVVVRSYQLRGADAPLVIPPTPAGLTVTRELAFATEPALPLLLVAEPLRGPGDPIPVELVEEGKRLSVKIPADAPPGTYRGRVLVRPSDPPLPRREVQLVLEVQARYTPPGQARIAGAWGWVSGPVEVHWPSLTEVPVTLTAGEFVRTGPLEGQPEAAGGGEPVRIDPELDVRWQPLDGWSGEALSSQPRRLALQVFVSSDHPGGLYEGTIRLDGPERDPITVPVRLEVRR